jgi:hypothetical protein
MEWQGLSYFQEGSQASTDSPPTLNDLISGVLICSMSFRGYQDFLQNEGLAAQLKQAGDHLQLHTVDEKQALFGRYLAEGLAAPEVEIPDHVSSGVALGTPWLQCVRLCLMSRLHVSSEATFDYPYRQALWECFSLRESEGKLVINAGQMDTSEMLERIETLEALNAAFMLEMEAKRWAS